jgi:hypothetical protein
MRDDDRFELHQFFNDLTIPVAEQPIVKACLVNGLAAYYQDLYGYDKYGKYPEALLPERMYEPYIMGYGAVEVVRCSNLSVETRLKVVKYTMQQTDPMEEYGTPYGLPVLLHFLAQQNSLDARTFNSVMLVALCDRHRLLNSLTKDELFRLIDWLVLCSEMPPAQQLWWLQTFFSIIETPQHSKAFLERLIDNEQIPVALRRELCQTLLESTASGEPPVEAKILQAQMLGEESAMEAVFLDAHSSTLSMQSAQTPGLASLFGTATQMLLMGQLLGAMPPSTRRRAVLALVQLGEDPLTVCQAYLSDEPHFTTEAINQGIADILLTYHQQLPETAIRELVEQGIRCSKATVRKLFFAVGYELLGEEYLNRALQNSTRSIRDWAEKQGKENPPATSKKRTQGKHNFTQSG